MPCPTARSPWGLSPAWGWLLTGTSIPEGQCGQAELGEGDVPEGWAGDRHVPTMGTYSPKG